MDHQPNQNAVNVLCYRCGQRYLTQGDAIQESRAQGWRQTECTHRMFCPGCQCPRHPLNVPYFVNDDRVSVSERGWFIAQRNAIGVIIVWKLVLNIPPTWELHKAEELFV